MTRRAVAFICPHCGKSFAQNNKRTKRFCSASCRVMYHRMKSAPTPMERLLDQNNGNAFCLECGKKYYRKTSRGCYCSSNCRVAAYRREKSAS